MSCLKSPNLKPLLRQSFEILEVLFDDMEQKPNQLNDLASLNRMSVGIHGHNTAFCD